MRNKGDIVGVGNLEPTQPTRPAFAVDCVIRFSTGVKGHSEDLQHTTDFHYDRCHIRRLDAMPISDGFYTLHIDHGGANDVLKLKRVNSNWYPVD